MILLQWARSPATGGIVCAKDKEVTQHAYTIAKQVQLAPCNLMPMDRNLGHGYSQLACKKKNLDVKNPSRQVLRGEQLVRRRSGEELRWKTLARRAS